MFTLDMTFQVTWISCCIFTLQTMISHPFIITIFFIIIFNKLLQMTYLSCNMLTLRAWISHYFMFFSDSLLSWQNIHIENKVISLFHVFFQHVFSNSLLLLHNIRIGNMDNCFDSFWFSLVQIAENLIWDQGFHLKSWFNFNTYQFDCITYISLSNV